jgi:hypothetical protein
MKVRVILMQVIHMTQGENSDALIILSNMSFSDDLDDAPLQVAPGSSSVGKTRRRVQDPRDLFNTVKNIVSCLFDT